LAEEERTGGYDRTRTCTCRKSSESKRGSGVDFTIPHGIQSFSVTCFYIKLKSQHITIPWSIYFGEARLHGHLEVDVRPYAGIYISSTTSPTCTCTLHLSRDRRSLRPLEIHACRPLVSPMIPTLPLNKSISIPIPNLPSPPLNHLHKHESKAFAVLVISCGRSCQLVTTLNSQQLCIERVCIRSCTSHSKSSKASYRLWNHIQTAHETLTPLNPLSQIVPMNNAWQPWCSPLSRRREREEA